MTTKEIIAKVEEIQTLEDLLKEVQTEIETLKDSIKLEMNELNTSELVVGVHIIRWTTVLSNRFDSTAFKKVMPDIYKAYTKQTTSRRFTIS